MAKDKVENKVDNVNHPKHYEGSTSLECIQVMELIFGLNAVLFFCLCNSFKYLWRFKNKNGLEDVKKAKWYLDYAERRIERACAEPISENVIKAYHRLNDLYIIIGDKIASKEVTFND